jgi:FMN-dependent NADH-azoreductase
MKTLLTVRTSIFGDAGASSKLADRYAATWRRENPFGRVLCRDLVPESMPHLTAGEFAAFGASPEERTPEQQALIAFSDTLIGELLAADVIVLAVPMYNFGVPSALRAYFDRVARAGVTFRYTAEGPEGLIKDKKVYVIATRGGRYSPETEVQTSYLKQFLSFLGLTDVEFVYVEGLAMGEEVREESLATASRHVDECASIPVAA